MKTNMKIIKIITAILVGILVPKLSFCLSTTGSEVASENFNPAMIISWILIILIILFTLVIYVLGKVLVSSTKERMEKQLKSGMKILLLPALLLPNLSEASSGVGFNTTWSFWYLLIGILVLQFIIILIFSYIIKNNLSSDKVTEAAESKSWFGKLSSGKFWDRFNNAKDLEEEKSILLDHDYDGIQELDNDLPPWWKYGFYLTIIWAVFYLFYYHVSSNGLSSKQEYENEMAVAEKQVAAYKAGLALNVDENSVTIMTNTSDLATGKKVFERLNCGSCHAADGGGGIGPNLTDNYWIHGGSVKNIFKTIKYGANNGMKAWEDDMSAVEMQQVTSYVLSLQGSAPADPKGPEGELFDDKNSSNAESDSLSTSNTEDENIELTFN